MIKNHCKKTSLFFSAVFHDFGSIFGSILAPKRYQKTLTHPSLYLPCAEAHPRGHFGRSWASFRGPVGRYCLNFVTFFVSFWRLRYSLGPWICYSTTPCWHCWCCCAGPHIFPRTCAHKMHNSETHTPSISTNTVVTDGTWNFRRMVCTDRKE